MRPQVSGQRAGCQGPESEHISIVTGHVHHNPRLVSLPEPPPPLEVGHAKRGEFGGIVLGSPSTRGFLEARFSWRSLPAAWRAADSQRNRAATPSLHGAVDGPGRPSAGGESCPHRVTAVGVLTVATRRWPATRTLISPPPIPIRSCPDSPRVEKRDEGKELEGVVKSAAAGNCRGF